MDVVFDPVDSVVFCADVNVVVIIGVLEFVPSPLLLLLLLDATTVVIGMLKFTPSSLLVDATTAVVVMMLDEADVEDPTIENDSEVEAL